MRYDNQENQENLYYFSRPNVTYTFQALSEEDRKLWMDAMDGKEPVSISFIFHRQNCRCNRWDIFQICRLGSSVKSEDTTLDETGFTFVTKCIVALEERGKERIRNFLFQLIELNPRLINLIIVPIRQDSKNRASTEWSALHRR